MTLPEQMAQLVSEWVATGDEAKEQPILDLLDTPEYRALSYGVRNAPFLTSSKLKEFRACAYHAKLRYIDQIDMGFENQEYFTIGSAVDLRLTDGEEAYRDRYAVVARRTDKAVEENAGRLLLTNSQAATIDLAVTEYLSRDQFPKQPTKKNVLFLLHGIPAKCELDHFSEAERMIEDIKTTASITTFDPSMYDLQAAFYSLGVEKRYGIQCQVALNVVDKHSDYSRSHRWVFTRPTLQARFYEIETLAAQWKDSIDSGIWPHCNVDTEEGRRIAWGSEYWSRCPFCKQMTSTIL